LSGLSFGLGGAQIMRPSPLQQPPHALGLVCITAATAWCSASPHIAHRYAHSNLTEETL
jgi:apolipoprotein N-acyltransferase